jgi:shikimate kinase
MRIFLAGVSCVGKTSIGTCLAKLLNYNFFDFDDEVEKYYGMPIDYLQKKYITMDLFRQQASIALLHILSKNESKNAVIALPPSGLMSVYWKIVNESSGTIIVLKDSAANVLNRIEFFDKDSKLITKNLSEKDSKYYLSEIQKDIIYYNNSYKKAHYSVSIDGLNIKSASKKLKELLSKEVSK